MQLILFILARANRFKFSILVFNLFFRESLEFICNHLTANIQKLNLSGYRTSFTTSDLLNLVKRCNQLVELNVSDCSMLTPEAIDVIANHLHGLISLSLSRCTKIKPVCLLELRDIPNLSHLSVFGMVLEGNLRVLRRNLPHLAINEAPLEGIARASTSSQVQLGKRGQDRSEGSLLWDVKLWQ